MGDRGVILFFAGCFLVVTASIAVATAVIAREGFGSNGAAWVQAAGSIAAIAGTAWLFQRDTTRRRRERRALGEEVAWAVRFAIKNAQLEARIISGEISDKGLLQRENPKRHWLLQTENCRNVLEILAKRTDHIHPALNHLANNAALLLRQMDEDILKALAFVERGESPSLEVATDVARYINHFEQVIQTLDDRMRGVVKALDENGDTLPVQKFGAWKIPED